MTTRLLAAVGLAFVVFAAPGCQREPDDLRGQLHALLDDIEAIAREEIDLLEEMIARPGLPSLQTVWRDRLDEAVSAIDQLPALRADINASTDAELAATVASSIMSVVETMRDAINDRMQRLRNELGGSQVA